MSDEPMAYVGFCRKCGAAYMAIVDAPEHAKSVAREVAKVLADGDRVEHVTCAWVRENWKACKCDAKPPSAQLSLFAELTP